MGYLPSEIIAQIVDLIDEGEGLTVVGRQATLRACCLVSRQWYNETIFRLYRNPFIDGSRFQKFAATVCPPLSSHGPGVARLASHVVHLDMGRLVHESSNSMTCRLLGRVKKNLESFIAPKYSFAYSALTPLSKCSKLEKLDLSLVGSSVGAEAIRKALHRLQNLKFLRLPDFDIAEVPTGPETSWPPSLSKLFISGNLSSVRKPMNWPPALKYLRLTDCRETQPEPLDNLIQSFKECPNLTHFSIIDTHGQLEEQPISTILKHLPRLTFLSLPGEYITDVFFLGLFILAKDGSIPNPLPLRVLEFAQSSTPVLEFSVDAAMVALREVLSNVTTIVFHMTYSEDEGKEEEDRALIEILEFNAEKRTKAVKAKAGSGAGDDIVGEAGEDAGLGVFYFDD
ncbi:hypothetical protein FQN54_003560 [Arachnomyces sp. PD_36]|nr:hypothetical protein FQN54_003560 [Arachnomyces sp. PD_36]